VSRPPAQGKRAGIIVVLGLCTLEVESPPETGEPPGGA
jgi:hypothetical protein